MELKLLLHGIDTVQCAYYLKPTTIDGIDFYLLEFQKEILRKTKKKNPKPITLGSCDFLLQAYGSSSGYPIIITNEDYKIECGKELLLGSQCLVEICLNQQGFSVALIFDLVYQDIFGPAEFSGHANVEFRYKGPPPACNHNKLF